MLSRRSILRGAGAAMALPWLDAMTPALGATSQVAPRRFVSICHGLGFHGPRFFPSSSGKDFELPVYLQPLAALRGQFTVISGTSHPEVGGGHNSESSFLTAAPYSGTPSYKNSISLDQLMAERLGAETRFSSLVLSAKNLASSYTRSGAMIPPESSSSRLFAKLFVQGSPAERKRQIHRLQLGQSIMDTVGEDAKRLERNLGPADREKLDAWFTNVREVERRLAKAEGWAARPKPSVDAPPPTDIPDDADLAGRQRVMLDVMSLALQTDSTRFITLHLQGGNGVPPIDGVEEGHHSLSHHGKDEHKLAQLERIETALMQNVATFLHQLQKGNEGDSSLLDHTTVLLGSNLGNASNHDTKNMPIMLAGGGFPHGRHLAFDPRDNEPLPNLFLSLLHHFGLEDERFASSTRTLPGLT